MSSQMVELAGLLVHVAALIPMTSNTIGQVITVNGERFRCVEPYFQPHELLLFLKEQAQQRNQCSRWNPFEEIRKDMGIVIYLSYYYDRLTQYPSVIESEV